MGESCAYTLGGVLNRPVSAITPSVKTAADPDTATCLPPPVEGNLLQVMPWPVHHNMTDHQIEAIYEYLSAIPCIDNTTSPPPRGAPNELRNDCGDDHAVVQDTIGLTICPHFSRMILDPTFSCP